MNGRRRSIPVPAAFAPRKSARFCSGKPRSRCPQWRTPSDDLTPRVVARRLASGDFAHDHSIPVYAGMRGWSLLRRGSADIAGDLPGAGLLGVADLVAAKRRDRLRIDEAGLPGWRCHMQEKWLVGIGGRAGVRQYAH